MHGDGTGMDHHRQVLEISNGRSNAQFFSYCKKKKNIINNPIKSYYNTIETIMSTDLTKLNKNVQE